VIMIKPRILIIENSIAVTGALKSILRSSSYFKNDFEFIFVTPKGSKAIPLIEELNYECYELSMREIRRNFFDLLLYFPTLIVNVLRLFSIIKKNKIDLIIQNDFYNLIPPFYKLLGGQVPYLSYVRFLPSKFSPLIVKFWMTFHNRYASSIIAVSHAVERELPTTRNILVIYNELPSIEINYTPPRNKIFLYPANYIKGKGQEVALRSFSMIHKQFPEWRLRFVGGDMGLFKNMRFKAELAVLARSLGVEDKIDITGYRELMVDEYLGSGIVLNFSESESFSLTCLESMYYGRPVVATKSGGPEEIIDQGQTGLLVPVGDVHAIVEAMKFLIEAPEKAEEMASEGFKRSRKKFDREFIKQRIQTAYTNAIKDKSIVSI